MASTSKFLTDHWPVKYCSISGPDDPLIGEGNGYTLRKNKNDQNVLKAAVSGLGAMPEAWVNVCIDKEVSVLNLKGTGISRLPERLADHNLEALFLSGNGLEDVPPDTYKLTTLKFLDLSHNNLKHLTDGIYKLVNLEVLDLVSNPSLIEVPVEMGHRLKKLKTIYHIPRQWPNYSPNSMYRSWALREQQLLQYGPKALPIHQEQVVGEAAIDILAIYLPLVIKVTGNQPLATYVTGKFFDAVEDGGHCCTPVETIETKTLTLGLQNCRVILLCICPNFPLGVVSQAKESGSLVVAVKMTYLALSTELEEEVSRIREQGLLVELQDTEYLLIGYSNKLYKKLSDLLKNYEVRSDSESSTTSDKRPSTSQLNTSFGKKSKTDNIGMFLANIVERHTYYEIFLLDLSKKLGSEWYGLGVYLGLELAQLETIRASHSDNVDTQKHVMLVKWYRMCTEANKIGVLIEALKRAGRQDLAYDLSQ